MSFLILAVGPLLCSINSFLFFRYQWECFVLNDPYAACFKNESTPVTTPSPKSVSASALRELPVRGGREYDPSVHSWFPPSVGSNLSALMFQAEQLVEKDKVFVFKVEF